jgi:hypothetical protein
LETVRTTKSKLTSIPIRRARSRQDTAPSPSGLVRFHRALGNAGTANLARYLRMKSELTVGAPGDRYEREADAVADRVMAMPEPTVQRQELEEEEPPKVQAQVEEDDELARAKPSREERPVRGAVSAAKLHVATCPGAPLAPAAREFFEPRFGRDFGGVRVHTCDDAVGMCKGLNAQAFTYRNNIFFNRGKYEPGTSSGKRLLAHELAHTMQQGKGVPPIQRRVPEANVSCAKYPRRWPIFKVIGTRNPVGVIRAADRTAIKIIKLSLASLGGSQKDIRGGAYPDSGSISDGDARSLYKFYRINAADKTVWTTTKRTMPGGGVSVQAIVDDLKAVLKIINSGSLRYRCLAGYKRRPWLGAGPGGGRAGGFYRFFWRVRRRAALTRGMTMAFIAAVKHYGGPGTGRLTAKNLSYYVAYTAR